MLWLSLVVIIRAARHYAHFAHNGHFHALHDHSGAATAQVTAAAWSADGLFLVVACVDYTVRVFNTEAALNGKGAQATLKVVVSPAGSVFKQ